MKRFDELRQWLRGAEEAFGDPSRPVCQLFFRWSELSCSPAQQELICTRSQNVGEITLWMAPVMPLDVSVAEGDARITRIEADSAIKAFGAKRIAPGLWYLNPSFNFPGVIHAFVVLYGVPDPAPWEKRIHMAQA